MGRSLFINTNQWKALWFLMIWFRGPKCLIPWKKAWLSNYVSNKLRKEIQITGDPDCQVLFQELLQLHINHITPKHRHLRVALSMIFFRDSWSGPEHNFHTFKPRFFGPKYLSFVIFCCSTLFWCPVILIPSARPVPAAARWSPPVAFANNKATQNSKFTSFSPGKSFIQHL